MHVTSLRHIYHNKSDMHFERITFLLISVNIKILLDLFIFVNEFIDCPILFIISIVSQYLKIIYYIFSNFIFLYLSPYLFLSSYLSLYFTLYIYR